MTAAAAYSRTYRERHPGIDHAYYLAHREQTIRRVTDAYWSDEGIRAARRAYNASPAQKARVRAYRRTPRGAALHRLGQARRRAALAGALLIVNVESDDCGICLQPLQPDAPTRTSWATTIGHEPPLTKVRREGWLVVVQRPEHWGCNNHKRARHDGEKAA